MTSETLVEEGIVLDSKNGKAVIQLISNENCHSCGAKPFCKPEDSEKNKLQVEDPYGVSAGDKVKISVEGKSIVFASFTLYGLPLILLIISILFGLYVFNPSKYIEGYSFLFGISILSSYYLILFRVSSKKNRSLIPKIIFVERKS